MVQYKNIIKAIDLYITKCPTIAEIRSLLGNMSFTEKSEQLREKNLLNEGEFKHYQYLNSHIVELQDDLYEARRELDGVEGYYARQMYEHNVRSLTRMLNSEEKALFDYEKRLFNGYKPREAQVIEYDISDYAVDEDGAIEDKQIELQSNIEFTNSEMDSLQEYFGYGADLVNSKIYNGDTWNSLDAQEKEEMIPYAKRLEKDLPNVINKTDGLTENTILYRGTKFDVSKVVGDTINFKGFTSTSFDKSVGDDYNRDGKWSNTLVYTYQFLMPKGTKGFCPNDLSHGVDFTNFREEHEYLLNKGFKGKIVDIDYENQVVTVMPV